LASLVDSKILPLVDLSGYDGNDGFASYSHGNAWLTLPAHRNTGL